MWWLRSKTVHPRGCGEYAAGGSIGATPTGSSPRVRGIHQPAQVLALLGRFIPAGAGNTFARHTQPSLCPVHPRGCGEYDCIQVSTWG